MGQPPFPQSQSWNGALQNNIDIWGVGVGEPSVPNIYGKPCLCNGLYSLTVSALFWTILRYSIKTHFLSRPSLCPHGGFIKDSAPSWTKNVVLGKILGNTPLLPWKVLVWPRWRHFSSRFGAFWGLLGLYRRTEAIKGRQNASGVDPRSTFHGSKDVFPDIFHRTTFLVHEGAESVMNPPWGQFPRCAFNGSKTFVMDNDPSQNSKVATLAKKKIYDGAKCVNIQRFSVYILT